MSNVTLTNIVKGAKNPAIVSLGIMTGVCVQKMLNKIINTDVVTNGLGYDGALALKNYASPILTTAIGIAVSMSAEDETIKKLGTGVAISGPLNVGMQLLWDKNLLAGLNDGIMGFLGGDEDFDDLEGYEEEDEEEEPAPAAINGVQMPLPIPSRYDDGHLGAQYEAPLVF